MYILALSNNVLYIQDITGLAPQSYDLSLFLATVIENDLQVVEIATGKVAAYLTFDQLEPIEGVTNMLEAAYSIGLITPPVAPPQLVQLDSSVEIANFPDTQQVQVTNETPIEVTESDAVPSTRQPFSVDLGSKSFDLPATDKYYLLFIFRPKVVAPVTFRTIAEAFISVLGQTNDDFLINVCINPTLTSVVLNEAWWTDIEAGSELQYIRPKITGLTGFAEVPTAIEVSTLGWNVFAKYGRQNTEIGERMANEIHLPTDASVQYAIVVSSDSTGCRVKAGISFIEKQ